MTTTYTVSAPLALAKGTDGRIGYYYRGATLEDNVPAEEKQRLVDLGMVTAQEALPPIGWDPSVDFGTEIPSVVTGEPAVASPDTTPEDGKPGTAASKADWVNYATSRGLSREEAEAATKADLIDRFGG